MLLRAGTRVRMRATATVRLENPNLTMDEAEATLRAKGNDIVARDDAERTFTIMDVEREVVLESDTEVPEGTPVA